MKNRLVKKSRLWIPPWAVIGSVIILVPIFFFWTMDTINRQKEGMTRLLLEKGAALIRSFEAGAKTGIMGMMGMGGDRFQLQRLLTETAQQPDIVYIIVTDKNGIIRAHNDPQKIGGHYGQDINLNKVIASGSLEWRLVPHSGGPPIFEVFRRFMPEGIEMPMTSGRGMPEMMKHRRVFPGMPGWGSRQVIFVGLDTKDLEEAREKDTGHIVLMAVILLLIGFGGIFTLFLVQAYLSTKSSLTRIKAFSDNVVENMPIGLLALDTDKKIMALNQEAESILGMSFRKTAGKMADDVLPDQFLELLNEVGYPRKVVERETDYSLTDGRTLPMDISAFMLESDNKDFLGYIILFRDMTEIQSLKKEIERGRRLASIGRLAAGVAHEIRNPLSSIKGFATYFGERYRDVPEDKKTSEIMVQEVERLNRVITQLLEFARPLTIEKKPASMETLLLHSMKIIERDAREKGITIQKDIPSDMRDVSVDKDRISQVLLNLYINAIEAIEQGGVLSVALEEEIVSQRIKITIKDTGRGIELEDLAHIFDPYYTTKPAGTGLGLAIVHNIVESHDGEVKIESKPGKGTTAIIYLPYN